MFCRPHLFYESECSQVVDSAKPGSETAEVRGECKPPEGVQGGPRESKGVQGGPGAVNTKPDSSLKYQKYELPSIPANVFMVIPSNRNKNSSL